MMRTRSAATSPSGGPARLPESPSEAVNKKDTRFEMLDSFMKRQRFQPDSLIEVLHAAQELFGRLQKDVLLHVAKALKLPPSRVYGVATFYHLFSFAAPARHTCVVCTGTACYVKGGDAILSVSEQELGVVAGKTRADGEVSLSTARCLGACGLAPIAVYDGEVHAHQTAELAIAALKKWRQGGPG
ncbi:MAG TPA: bidirectional hydrogenase complex protein HoxE [Polyangiaceae bacterium]|nr:bidirectional hydrogenase complex protein HoxE [Polyangiaceae bacterium]